MMAKGLITRTMGTRASRATLHTKKKGASATSTVVVPVTGIGITVVYDTGLIQRKCIEMYHVTYVTSQFMTVVLSALAPLVPHISLPPRPPRSE